MKSIISLILFCTVFVPQTMKAGIDEPWDSFQQSDLFTFFGMKISNQNDLEDGITVYNLEPGGFQEHIDITIYVDGDGNVSDGRLKVSREFIGSNQALAFDLIKSYLNEMASHQSGVYMSPLIEKLFADPQKELFMELGIAYDVILGERPIGYAEQHGVRFSFENAEFPDIGLAIEVFVTNKILWDEKTPDRELLISDAFMKNHQLDPGQSADGMVSFSGMENSEILNVMEFVFEFPDAETAAKALESRLSIMSEGGVEKLQHELDWTENDLMVAEASEQMKELQRSLGVPMEMYFFLFHEGKYVVKVFVSAKEDTPYHRTAVFATEARNVIRESAK